jgi:hypothetical protein
MGMMKMVTSSLGMAGNPTVTLLAALVINTIQVGVVQGDAYWTFMPNPLMVHPITWQSHPVPIFNNDMVHIGGHSSGRLVPQSSGYNFTGNAHPMGAWEQSNDTVNLWQLKQQILAMQKAYDNIVSPANIAKTILDDFKGFNLFNLLKHSFSYLAGLFTCFLVLSVGCRTVQRQFLGLRGKLHWEYLRNKKGEDVGRGL